MGIFQVRYKGHDESVEINLRGTPLPYAAFMSNCILKIHYREII